MRCLIVGGCTGGAVAPARRLKLGVSRSDTPPQIWMQRDLDRGEFGQLTTSFAIIDEDVAFLIDNGLGVQITGDAIQQAEPKQVAMFQSHYHYDHIEGMHLNPLLYRPDSPLTQFFCPKVGGVVPNQLWNERLLNTSHWPIAPKCQTSIYDFKPGASLVVFDRDILTSLQNHPGESCGYRIQLSDKKSIVIATDVELSSAYHQKNFARFVDGADFLVVECQLREGEYLGKVGVMDSPATPMIGWGHSTPEMILASLERCSEVPKSVFVTHHDSRRDQTDLRNFEGEFRSALLPLGIDCSFLYEAQDVDLDELESM
ncbi:MAG: putative beta-lactamase domain-containing protein [Parcubacteria group bacterium Gr01-1014_20]|nr:MAG: putative beta-lactamase domain-containing protein [Parcubacteria group bacterium Gr01-1014_20]